MSSTAGSDSGSKQERTPLTVYDESGHFTPRFYSALVASIDNLGESQCNFDAAIDEQKKYTELKDVDFEEVRAKFAKKMDALVGDESGKDARRMDDLWVEFQKLQVAHQLVQDGGSKELVKCAEIRVKTAHTDLHHFEGAVEELCAMVVEAMKEREKE